MAVTRPPAPHRRRAASRTVAVALAATIAVGAAAVAIPAAQAATTLKDLATAAGKDIGFALDPNRLSESAYKSIADSEFNLVVAENAMKWDATEPSQNSFSYGSRRPGGQLRREHGQEALRPHARLALADCRAGPTTCPGPRSVGDEEPRHQRRDALQGQGRRVGRRQRGVRRQRRAPLRLAASSRSSATGTSRRRSGRRAPRTRTPSCASTTTTPTPSTRRAPRSTTWSRTSSPAASRSTASASSRT